MQVHFPDVDGDVTKEPEDELGNFTRHDTPHPKNKPVRGGQPNQPHANGTFFTFFFKFYNLMKITERSSGHHVFFERPI